MVKKAVRAKQPKTDSGLVKTLRILLGIQAFMLVLSLFITYAAYHDGVDDMAGLLVLFPLGIFALLGIVSLVGLSFYIVKIINRESEIDWTVVILVAINLLLLFFSGPLSNWVSYGF